jgi:FixJ family two-component response regulator
LARLLSALRYDTELYVSAEEFLVASLTTEATCLLVDVQLGESSGIELARHLANAGFAIPFIFMTADRNQSIQRRAMEVGCIDFLVKPFSADALREALLKLPRPRRG